MVPCQYNSRWRHQEIQELAESIGREGKCNIQFLWSQLVTKEPPSSVHGCCSMKQKGECASSSAMLIIANTLNLLPSLTSCPPGYKVVSKINNKYSEVELLDHAVIIFSLFFHTVFQK